MLSIYALGAMPKQQQQQQHFTVPPIGWFRMTYHIWIKNVKGYVLTWLFEPKLKMYAKEMYTDGTGKEFTYTAKTKK